tara:strand:+ start:5920 stop:7191 length:1272 start_codon:yes stop_codon:yes gene_type:complete
MAFSSPSPSSLGPGSSPSFADLTVTGDLTVNGNFTFGDAVTDVLTVDGVFLVDTTAAEAVLVRVDSDGGDVFTISTAANAHKATVGGTYTSGGTDDFGIKIAQTLNDSGAAGGSDTYRGLKIDLTTTDVTGWDNVYLATLGSSGNDVFTFTDGGVFSAASGSGTLELSHSTNGIINVGTAGTLSLQLAGTPGAVLDSGGFTTDNVSALTASTTLTIQDQSFSAADSALTMCTGTHTQSSGTAVITEITPTINQSSSAGYTAFSIDVTETATGSGTGLLMSSGTDGNPLWTLSNQGVVSASQQQRGSQQTMSITGDTTDGTPQSVTLFTSENDTGIHVTVKVVGMETVDSDETASYVLHGTFQNDNGTLTQIGSTTSAHTAESTAGWDCDFSVSSPDIQITFTGAASTDINWMAVADLVTTDAS